MNIRNINIGDAIVRQLDESGELAFLYHGEIFKNVTKKALVGFIRGTDTYIDLYIYICVLIF